ncbi:hypothetical protein SDC9_125659 [bioreactor metagenome]|uniref:Uncharacterized protein n=1 Tax=bioreactor metagenome TaxID=1076179 RepID=A0A645CP18_9ZZZZ
MNVAVTAVVTATVVAKIKIKALIAYRGFDFLIYYHIYIKNFINLIKCLFKNFS